MRPLTVTEKLDEMCSNLAELARKMNKEGEHDAALALQQAIVAVKAAEEESQAFAEVECDWESYP